MWKGQAHCGQSYPLHSWSWAGGSRLRKLVNSVASWSLLQSLPPHTHGCRSRTVKIRRQLVGVSSPVLSFHAGGLGSKRGQGGERSKWVCGIQPDLQQPGEGLLGWPPGGSGVTHTQCSVRRLSVLLFHFLIQPFHGKSLPLL